MKKKILIIPTLAIIVVSMVFGAYQFGVQTLESKTVELSTYQGKAKVLSAEELRAQIIAERNTQFTRDYTPADFLEATNSFRITNGLGALALNEALNASACAKADHMIANDYWEHVAPDGTEPWYFYNQVGYHYSLAGENLAYGFLSATATIEGWENSPTHKDNMLGDYVEMGVCSRQADNYRSSGYEVVTVAHYATP